MPKPKTVADVVKMAQDVQMVDLRFTDLPGTWQHFTIPARECTEELFEDGIGFDGSSIRGFQEIHESDMLLMPDPATAFIDQVLEVPTLVIICDVFDPITRQPYTRDPRYVARKAEAYLKQTGIADISYWGPEAEFFIFNDVRYGGRPSTRPSITSTARRAGGTAARRAGQPGQPDPAQARLFPGAAHRHPAGRAQQDRAGPGSGRACRSRCTTTRWRPPVRPRSTCALAR